MDARRAGEGNVREIVDYIERNIKKNYAPDQLEIALLRQGYSKTAVKNAFEVVEMSMSKAKVRAEALKEEQKKAEVEAPKVVELPKKKGFFARLFGM